MKKSFVLVMLSVALVAVSCSKEEEFTVNTRTPNKVEFVQRVLPDGMMIGYNKPSDVEVVDLGLSIKWANKNLGAQKVSDAGDLFAWGEILTSSFYGWSNYEFNNFHADNENVLYLTKYCFDRYGESQDLAAGGIALDALDDAAYVQWGKGFRMPTEAEIQELINKCTWTYDKDTQLYTATGPNGNSIIFPTPKYASGEEYNKGTAASPVITSGLWSSSLSKFNSPDAQKFNLNYHEEEIDGQKVIVVDCLLYGMNRCFGNNIRPVYAE